MQTIRRIVHANSCIRFSLFVSMSFALLLAAAREASAQLPQTTLNALSPGGGKAGTTFDVKVASGANLDDLTALTFSRTGIKAVPKTQKSGAKTVPVVNTFVVTIDANVPPGLYEVRAAGSYGLSNPRTFVVGRLDEISEKEPNNTRETATPISIDKNVNGVIGSIAEMDFFKFEGKQGQQITIDCRAARIDSRLRAAVELFAPDGQRLLFSRNAVRLDPVATVKLPANGSYLVKLYDFTYRGGADYFYRLSVNTAPRIDFVFPTSGVPGTTSKFTLYGRNLPGGQSSKFKIAGQTLQKVDVRITVPKEPTASVAANLAPHEAGIDAFSYTWKTPKGDSNPVLIHLAGSPAGIEKEPNDDPKTAQKIQLPAEISGHFQKRGDIDYFTFQAKAKQVYYVEVFSQRLGTSADPYLKIEQITKSGKGKETVRTITSSDDSASSVAPNTFNTSTDDPVYRFQIPSDGTYRISIRDRYFEGRGDPRLVYRLSIRRPKPDFRVVVLPLQPAQRANLPAKSGVLGLRKGENLPARVIVFRRDGFSGPIELTVQGLPKGVVCKGGIVSGKLSDSYLIFTADEKAAEWSGLIKVLATAKLKDPAKIAAVAAAKAAVTSATGALPRLRKAVQTAEAPVKTAKSQLDKAKAAAAKNPKNKTLANQATAKQKTYDAARKKLAAAQTALKIGEKKLADAEIVLKKSEADDAAAVKTITREARPATIAWDGVNNISASQAHVARSLGLSVLEESAPIHITTDVYRVEANQGRQILMPTKLARRNGFNNNVPITVAGLPRNSGIVLKPKPINKGKNSELYRIFVATNAKVGIYTVFLRSTARISYRKGLDKLNLAKKAQAEAAKVVKTTSDASKAAVKILAAATQKEKTAAAVLKTATTAQTQSQTNATKTLTAKKQADIVKAKADNSLVDATAAVKSATAKLAAAKKAAAAKPKDKKLADAVDPARKILMKLQQTLKTAQTAKTTADQKATAAASAAKKAADALTAANRNLATAQAAVKTTAGAKTKAAAVAKAAADKAKAAATAKAAADRTVTAANNAARPRNINVFPISTPIIIEVKQAPGQLTAAVQSGGKLKRGGKLTIKVTIRRQNGFKGPVRLSLPLPPGVTGLSAPEVTIPANKKDGVLTVQASGKATLGKLANMVVRATMEFSGKAAIDAAVAINVSK